MSLVSRDGRWESRTAKTTAQNASLRMLAIVGGWQDKGQVKDESLAPEINSKHGARIT